MSRKWLGLLMGVSVAPLFAQPIPDIREFPINPDKKPCANFYEYACSKTIESFELREDRSKHTFSFSDSHERLIVKKKEFLQKLPQQKNLKGFRPTLKKVFAACMNTKARAVEEKSIVANLVNRVKAIKNRTEFLKFLSDQRQEAEFSFIDVGTTANKDNPDFKDFYFAADMMSLPERSYYKNDQVIKDYAAYITHFFKIVGDKKASQTAKSVVDLEAQFADNYPLPHELRKIWSQKSSISRSEIKKLYPSFNLEQDLKRVPSSTNINHFIPDNFAFVNKTLLTADLNSLKSLYLFQALSPIMDEGYPEYFAQKFAFSNKHLGGPAKRSDLAERCTKSTMYTYLKEIDYELVDEVFPNFPEKKFIGLAEKIRKSIISGIESNTWLSAKAKAGAIAKIKHAKLQLIKPRTEAEWYFNPKVPVQEDTFLGNTLKLHKAFQERMYAEIGKPRDKTRWGLGPLTINAYYSPSDNKFVMPIGILQPPFYDPKQPEFVNMGAVGTVIGHELGHGIDDNGSKYDFQGRLIQWMSDKDLAEFKKRGEALISQFDKTGHNGKLTLGENIGDLTGLSFAYNGAFPENNGTIEQKQKFFLQYARLWCSVIRPKTVEKQLKVDPHAIAWARVNEQVKHQPGFHEAYSCKKGDAMYLEPQDRVKIW